MWFELGELLGELVDALLEFEVSLLLGGGVGSCVGELLSGVLVEVLHRLVGGEVPEQVLVARWLMAWGDAFLTGMTTAIFVAFAPQWLATWSDERYLRPAGDKAD